MDFEWVAIALGDVVWISLAFALGLSARAIGLPPLVGFLATGFLLNAQGVTSSDMLQKLADLGITLLLFTVGLKLNLRTLARPQVWAVTGLHMALVVGVFGLLIGALALFGTPFETDLALRDALLIAFALSFSSTVFVVKVLEEKGQMRSLHGRIAVGILVMQDLAAALFLLISAAKVPSPWALLLLMLVPLRPLLHAVLVRVGHGELLVLYGLLLALGGAELFELVGLKGDVGALIVGVLISSHVKADEMAKTMLGFKDLFLLAFFLSIGLSGQPTLQTLALGALITPFIFLKSSLFFALLTGFKLRARTALMTSLNLTNYSEFGLIVAAIGVASGWIDNEWLIVIAIALSLSLAVSAVLNGEPDRLYRRYRTFWKRFQKDERLHDDQVFDTQGATIAVFGMGRVGIGTYDEMHKLFGKTVIGVDFDPINVREQRALGRNVWFGDPSDADFWDRVAELHTIELVLLTLPKLSTALSVLEQLEAAKFSGRVAATARYPDDVDALRQAGAETVFNFYTGAGSGFAAHVASQSDHPRSTT